MIDRPAVQTRERYDEYAYLAALQMLGLVPPVDRVAIHRAYRARAKSVHPDRFQDEEQKADATRSIQEINTAHAYAIKHWRGYTLAEQWGRTKPARARAPEATSWGEWVFLPVTAIYALTTIVLSAPILALARLAGPERRARWRGRRVPGLIWRLWLLAGPHGVTVALFTTVEDPAVKIWIGLSFLVMVSADIATLVTGDAHRLRRPLKGALVKLL
ncbi:MAG: DnaJ family molecular chaperone [Gemmatimonadota bacterium]